MGGGFKPGIPNKRDLTPPCVAGTPANATFVEIRNVTMAGSTMIVEDCSTNYAQINGGGVFPNGQNCDLTRNIFDPAGPRVANVTCPSCIRGVFVEIDRDWNASKTAPPMIGVNGTSERIDVQGFLYWNPDEVGEAWHLYSGWEIHPLTAWRRSGQTGHDFYLANRRLLSVQFGSSSPTNLFLGSLGGFQGTVSLATSASDAGIVVSLSTTSVHLNSTGWGSSAQPVLTVSAPGATPGAYLVTVTGTSGSITRASLLTVIVTKPDFTISASPDSFTLEAGTAADSQITLTSLSGFTGAIALTTPSFRGITFSINPTTMNLSAGSQNSSTITISTAPDADPGVYTVAVSGTAGTLSHSAKIPVEILTPAPLQGFDISASPSSISFVQGETGSADIILTSINSFTGNVTLTESFSPPNGLSCSLSVIEVTLGSSAHSLLSCTGTAGAYNVLIVGNGGSFSRTLNVAVDINEPPSITATLETVTVNAWVTGTSIITASNFHGIMYLEVSSSPGGGLSCSLDPGSLTSDEDAALLSCFGSAGTYTVTVTGTTNVESTETTITYVVEDFSLTVTPAVIALNPGISGSATVLMKSVNGFNATVTLGTAASPADGLICSMASTSINLDTSAATLLQCTGSPGFYSVTVTATSNSLQHRGRLSVTVSDFALYLAKSSMTIQAGQKTRSTVRVGGLNGFQGEVTLSADSSTAGIDGFVDPRRVTISGQQFATAVLTVSVASSVHPGDYPLMVSARNGPAYHSMNISITVLAETTGSSAGPSPIFGLDPFQFSLSLFSLAVMTIITVTFVTLFRRRRGSMSQGHSFPEEYDSTSE